MTSATTSSLPGATLADRLDTQAHAQLARASSGLSPASALLAWQDWAVHLATSPGKQIVLAQLDATQAQPLGQYMCEGLKALPTPEEVARTGGKSVDEIVG